MSNGPIVKPSDPCPCGERKTYKKCCRGKLDWNEIIRSGVDQLQYFSVRGRNIYFLSKVADALQLNQLEQVPLERFKAAFTEDAVRKIHDAVLEIWSPSHDIAGVLERCRDNVSGLYIGDYHPDYLSRAIVRHSLYAEKIILVDPFVHPFIMADEFNPLYHPAKYRSQTLKNVNLYLELAPWIDAGIVEIIRLPTDFDPSLKMEILKAQQEKFEKSNSLQLAQQETVKQLRERHSDNEAREYLLLTAPNSHIRKKFRELHGAGDKSKEDDFIDYVEYLRARDPNFLEPMGPNSSEQLHMKFSGASYPEAKMGASLTRSYLFTDLRSKWAEIELDRGADHVENRVWAPFAKAMQNAELSYLNGVKLNHALVLRQEERLEGLRAFMHKLWRSACTDAPFDEENAIYFANELQEEVKAAEAEWKKINANLIAMIGAGTSALLSVPLVATGGAAFAAAAFTVGGAAAMGWRSLKKSAFRDEHPAGFFMNIPED